MKKKKVRGSVPVAATERTPKIACAYMNALLPEHNCLFENKHFCIYEMCSPFRNDNPSVYFIVPLLVLDTRSLINSIGMTLSLVLGFKASRLGGLFILLYDDQRRELCMSTSIISSPSFAFHELSKVKSEPSIFVNLTRLRWSQLDTSIISKLLKAAQDYNCKTKEIANPWQTKITNNSHTGYYLTTNGTDHVYIRPPAIQKFFLRK